MSEDEDAELAEVIGPPLRFNHDAIDQYYAGLVPTVRACLAVFGSMALSGRRRPLSLILEGPSGAGKTAGIQMCMPKAEPLLNDYAYRSDKFTPKAFVTHAANVSPKDLEKVDLLPKLRDKVLLTKELAPIFGARDEELRDNIAILIAVLDGEGFISDSGMRGRRGYEEAIIFNWLGATTPLSQKVHRIMSQLGTRLLFYEVPLIELTEEELIDYAQNGNADEAAISCNQLVNAFLCEFFELHPVGTIHPDSMVFPSLLTANLTRCAKLLVKGRAEVIYEKDRSEWEPVSVAQSEGIWRVIDYFKELALGHALIDGRAEVNESDIGLITHVAISSIPGHLRPVINHLREHDELTSADCEGVCRVSRPTARKRLREVELLGIATRTTGQARTNEPDTVRLADEFLWLKIP
jgi:hypothetical protein